jgi:hypothetical protein
VDRIPEQSPRRLSGTDIPTVDIALHLVETVRDLNRGAVSSFVNVLVDVLYSPNRGAHLDVNMCTELTGQIGAVKNNKPIIKGLYLARKRP